MNVNVLSLFAGIGGLDLGLERAGMTVVGQVEIDPFCQRVLTRHWPGVPRHDDVRTTVGWWLREPRPRVDVIVGGYPCQPESTAGRRRGTDDERWLWPEFARIVHALRPRYVIGENVPGHRTKGLRFVLRDLERLGYTTRAGIVSAEEMGAPHERKRIFILAEMANTERDPGQQRWTGNAEQGGSEPAPRQDRHAGRGSVTRDVSNAAGERRVPGRSFASGARAPEGEQENRAEPTGRTWWAAEPSVDRVAYGVPGGVDRSRTLGNAVVPQVAEFVGRLLLSGQWRDDR